MRIYYACAMTYADPARAAWHDEVVQILRERGHMVVAPYQSEQASWTPADVYRSDTTQIDAADLILADVNEGSLGVGLEIARAHARRIPLVLLRAPADVSSFVEGFAAVEGVSLMTLETPADIARRVPCV